MKVTGKVDAQLGGKTFVIVDAYDPTKPHTPKERQQLAQHNPGETVLVLRGVDLGEIVPGSHVTVTVSVPDKGAFDAPQAPDRHRGGSDHLAPAPVVLPDVVIPANEGLTAEEQEVVEDEAAAEKAHKAEKKKGGK